MANYTKVFDNPYPNGWKNLPSESTPVTAEALQEHTDAIVHIEDYLYDNPSGGGGSDVQVEPLLTQGSHIADITVDGEKSEIYAPEMDSVKYGTSAEFERDKDSLPVGTTYMITDDAYTDIIPNNIYSLDEVRIGTFLDKPLYRKMVRKNSIAKSAEDVTALVSSLNINVAVNCTFICLGENQQGTVNCTLYKSSNSWKVFGWDSYSSNNDRYGFLAIEYTKVGE
ncbi:MAG: hypothetical protein MJ007_01905 [Paludibacteraceae bacterium]|nr:hypothetical protein [Paludibacteraceae bacterium]